MNKKLLLTGIILPLMMGEISAEQKSMQVWLKNGQQETFYVSDVDSVTFGIAAEQPYQELTEWTKPPVIKNAAPLSLSGVELEYVKAGNDLAKKYFKKICEKDDKGDKKNKFFSPISLDVALAMCANGASDQGALEIANALGFKDGNEIAEMNKYFNKIYLSMNSEIDSSIFSINNAIWPQKGYTVSEPFLSTVREQYYATVCHLDYQNDPKAAKEILDNWTNEMTRGLIPSIGSTPDTVTRLIISNACYFQAQWSSAFDSTRTLSDTFTNISGKKELVKMMNKATTGYAEKESFQLVTLPYKGPYSMALILPKDSVSVEEAMTAFDPQEVKTPGDEKIYLFLPKFEMNDNIDLSLITKDLGINDIFSQLPKVINNGDLWVENINQRTFIKLDEQKTEAAAATTIDTTPGSISQNEPITVKFNRPFGFAIVEKNTGMILFMGQYIKATN